MIDPLHSMGLSIFSVYAIMVGVRLAQEPVDIRPLTWAVAALLFYWAAVAVGAACPPVDPALATLKCNWTGKIVTTGAVLLAIAELPMVSRGAAGLRLQLTPGSALPALGATGLICALSWGIEMWADDGRDTSTERLLFQLLMSGLDEELFFRGLLLALLMRAFNERWSLLGAPVGPAAITVTFVFAAGRGLQLADGKIHLDPLIFALTGALGLGLLWVRQRTGSVVPAILAHNLMSAGNAFF